LAGSKFDLLSHPSSWVFPVISRGSDGTDRPEGTAFSIACLDGISRAVTAAHVVKDRDTSREWYLGVPSGKSAGAGHGLLDPAPIIAAHCHDQIDVACLDVALPAHYPSVSIIDHEPMFDWDVICFEYSPARNQTHPDGTSGLFADAWSHKGNIVRGYREDGVTLMNTSFPTMQGASGAPIMWRHEGELYAVGMAVGNLEQKFSPSVMAQTVTVREGDTFFEEINYFLPYGVALTAHELIRGLSKFIEPVVRQLSD
jgi:hypothetical protein